MASRRKNKSAPPVLRLAHGPHRIFGGQFSRRRQLLIETLRDHDVAEGIINAWIAHQDDFAAALQMLNEHHGDGDEDKDKEDKEEEGEEEEEKKVTKSLEQSSKNTKKRVQ